MRPHLLCPALLFASNLPSLAANPAQGNAIEVRADQIEIVNQGPGRPPAAIFQQPRFMVNGRPENPNDPRLAEAGIGFGPGGAMALGNDEGEPFWRPNMTTEFRAQAQLSAIRKIQNKPELTPKQRLGMLKSLLRTSAKPEMTGPLPPPPPDFLPQYSLADYLQYADYDADHDGQLSEPEIAAYVTAEQKRLAARAKGFNAAMMEQFKKDLQDPEGQAAYGTLIQEVQAARQEAKLKEAEMIKPYDLDKDGKLNGGEYAWAIQQIENAAAQAEQEKHRQFERQRQEQLLRMEEARKKEALRFDLDGDGKLNDAERQRMQQERNLNVAAPPLEE